jgi:uncharacterized repeat protein (TIGR01451 family)
MGRRAAVIALLVCSIVFGVASAWGSGTPGVTPSSVSLTLDPGQSATVDKTVHTPTIPPKPDLVFLADTTGSMTGAISNVQANAANVMATVAGAQPLAQFASASYKDFDNSGCGPDPYVYRLEQPITAITGDVQTGINSWSAGGGCDTPESELNALYQVATDPATGFRTGSSRIIAWFGDAPGHDPSGTVTLAQAIAALQAANIRVIAINVGNLDGFGQATAITTATGGVLLNSGDDVANAILEGLSNLPSDIVPSYSCTSPDVSISWAPPSATNVPSDTDQAFTETVAVSPSAAPGQTVHCDVQFSINGVNTDEFKESVDVTIPGSDVSILKTGPSSVTEGQTFTYHLTVANAGPSTAVGATASDTLPANVSFVSASAGCSYAAPTVTCSAGNLAAGASQTFDVTVTAQSGGTSIVNTATAGSSTNEIDPGNNTSTVTTSLNHNPVCTDLALTGDSMWPPNHRLVRFTAGGATDADGNTLTTTITNVTQDEPLNGLGDGDTGPVDAASVAGHPDQVDLRAERSGTGDGRVYRVTVSVSDGNGGSCTATLSTATVPHDQAHPAVDSGSVFVDF